MKKNFGKAALVFDFSSGPSINDESWLRESKGALGLEVLFDADMVLKIKKETFLRNTKNKQQFIELLAKKLEENGCSVVITVDNVTVKIANVAIQYSKLHNTVVVGKEVNLIMILSFYATPGPDSFSVYYMYEETSKKPFQILNITEMKNRLGEVKSKHLLFAHAMGGCGATSQFHNISKASLFSKLDNVHFKNSAEIFCSPNSSEDSIIKAGIEVITSLYNGKANETLNKLRYRKFTEKAKRGTLTISCKALPPTEAAAKFHCLRVFYQVQAWMGQKLNPLNFGWVERNSILRPVSTYLPAAPANTLRKIRCGCQGDCDSTRCTCFKFGLPCTTACNICAGNSCSNRSHIDHDSDLDEEV